MDGGSGDVVLVIFCTVVDGGRTCVISNLPGWARFERVGKPWNFVAGSHVCVVGGSMGQVRLGGIREEINSLRHVVSELG